MVTQTYSHGIDDDLAVTLDKQRKALKLFNGGRAAAGLRNVVGLIGIVRALETTYGINGWHPHLHTLWFLEGLMGVMSDGSAMKIDRLRLKRILFCMWFNACKKVGLHTSYKHGLDVSTEEKQISGYIAKWGIESEMTKANYKTAKKFDSVTPWGMLAHIAEQGPQTKLYSAKFVEYAEIFPGERQLFWSKGMRARFCVEPELTDEEIAEKENVSTQGDIILASLSIDQWVPVTRYNLEAHLLSMAETHPENIIPFVLAVKHRYLQEKSDKDNDKAGTPRVSVPIPS